MNFLFFHVVIEYVWFLFSLDHDYPLDGGCEETRNRDIADRTLAIFDNSGECLSYFIVDS